MVRPLNSAKKSLWMGAYSCVNIYMKNLTLSTCMILTTPQQTILNLGYLYCSLYYFCQDNELVK